MKRKTQSKSVNAPGLHQNAWLQKMEGAVQRALKSIEPKERRCYRVAICEMEEGGTSAVNPFIMSQNIYLNRENCEEMAFGVAELLRQFAD